MNRESGIGQVPPPEETGSTAPAGDAEPKAAPPATESEAGPPDPEQQFQALSASVDEVTRQTRRFQEIIEEAEGSEDYKVGMKALRTFLTSRADFLDRVTIFPAEAGREVDPKGMREMIAEIRLLLSYPDHFLGNGGTSEVVTLRRSSKELDTMVCAKVINNYERYAEALKVQKEMQVMDSLRDLQVAGVRCPVPLFAYSSMREDGLVMEHLNAVNFQRVLERQTTEGQKDELPPGFDVDEYFSRLREYVTEMHKRGVIHNDLHLRNLMVDRVTGMPYIIDFGKARRAEELDKAKTSLEEESAKDIESLRLATKKAKDWLAGRS